MDKIDFSDVRLFGISSKFYQWIPGTILAEEIKKRDPLSKIVIGGFGNQQSATAALNQSDNFDYAIWGEGEYPLLELYNALSDEVEKIKIHPRVISKLDPKSIHNNGTSDKYLDFSEYVETQYDEFIHEINTFNIPIDRIPI